MKHDKMTVHEIANYTGITIRTLHYYDEIGLLRPSMVTESKYRIYSENDLDRLQQILFYREVGFSLKEIKELLAASVYTRQEALEHHLELLNLKKKHLDELIELVKETLSGKGIYSFSAFSNVEISELQQKYRDEIIERWGNTPEYNEFSGLFSKKSQKEQTKQWNDFLIYSQNFFERLAKYEMESPMLAAVQNMVREWQEYISEYFYHCSNEMLLNLGELYEYEERFSAYINRFGSEKLALFFNRAIKIYCAIELTDK